MAYEIEKGVPLVAGTRGHGAPPKYPFAQMEVGDSFFVPGKKTTDIGGAITYPAKKLGWTFRSRTVEGGVRIWRTA
mgnify:CR=1 FL=1